MSFLQIRLQEILVIVGISSFLHSRLEELNLSKLYAHKYMKGGTDGFQTNITTTSSTLKHLSLFIH